MWNTVLLFLRIAGGAETFPCAGVALPRVALAFSGTAWPGFGFPCVLFDPAVASRSLSALQPGVLVELSGLRRLVACPCLHPWHAPASGHGGERSAGGLGDAGGDGLRHRAGESRRARREFSGIVSCPGRLAPFVSCPVPYAWGRVAAGKGHGAAHLVAFRLRLGIFPHDSASPCAPGGVPVVDRPFPPRICWEASQTGKEQAV